MEREDRSETEATSADVPADSGHADAGVRQETREGDDQPREIGGRLGPEPTRFGDWEKNGRCIDF